MPSKLKISKKKYLDKTVEIILVFYKAGKSYNRIANQMNISQPSIVFIIDQAICN